MSIRKCLVGLVGVVLLLGHLGDTTFAEDIRQPEWRGQYRSVYAAWDDWSNIPYDVEDVWQHKGPDEWWSVPQIIDPDPPRVSPSMGRT